MSLDRSSSDIRGNRAVESEMIWTVLFALVVRILYLGVALLEVSQDMPLFRSDLFVVSSVDYWDIERRFYQFTTRVYKWQKIPYVNYPLEYPQLAGGLFQLIYSFQPGNFQAFALSLHLIQLPLEILTTAIVYKIASSMYNRRSASVVALLYNLSPMVLHTWVSRYDSIPVFFTIASLYLILQRKYVLSFLMVAIGIMFKWYPVVLVLPYYRYMKNQDLSRELMVKSFVVLVVFCFAVVSPFIVLSPEFFLESYIFHLGRGWNYQSLWILFLPIFEEVLAEGSLSRIISSLSMFLQTVFCFSVLLFRIRDTRRLILASSYVLMVFVFFTKFYSPQYTVWFSPFVLLSPNGFLGLLFYVLLQVSVYIEYPLLWDLRFSEVYPYFFWAVALKFLLVTVGILGIARQVFREIQIDQEFD
jgi:hypothetical protein